MTAEWPWNGQIYEVPQAREGQISLMRNIPGLTDDERYFLLGIVALTSSNPDRRTDQANLQAYLEANGRPLATATIKIRVLTLHEFGIFTRYELPRPKTRNAVVYQLADIAELMQSEKLLAREASFNRPAPTFNGRTIVPDEPHLLIEGSDDHKHAYSRKINHVILRRCSADPTHLGKKVPIVLPGYKETVFVTQRVASGIPPMDGTEDRLQQALLTMFKEHLIKFRVLHPDLQPSDIKNEWMLDMREVCRSMKLRPSSGNIVVQAKRLYQLRYNTFEIHFDPAGAAAKALNLLRNEGLPEFYKDEHEGTLHALSNDRIDQYFLSLLEPVRDEIVWSANQQALALEDKTKPSDTFNGASIDDRDLIYDRNGRLYRFYRVSFHPLVFQECLDDALGQLHKQPPSLLEEERVVARLLVYLAQRVIGKTRERPFEASWGDIATEVQPLQENQKLVFQQMEKVFKTENPAWNTGEDGSLIAALHGYHFETIIPPGKQRRRAQWKLKISRDQNHPYNGDTGPAAVARYLTEAKRAAGLLPN